MARVRARRRREGERVRPLVKVAHVNAPRLEHYGCPLQLLSVVELVVRGAPRRRRRCRRFVRRCCVRTGGGGRARPRRENERHQGDWRDENGTRPYHSAQDLRLPSGGRHIRTSELYEKLKVRDGSIRNPNRRSSIDSKYALDARAISRLSFELWTSKPRIPTF